MKKLFYENLATKLMALVLAGLTWFYLFQQGVDTGKIVVTFQPNELDKEVFASVLYEDANGNEISPGGPLEVRLSGPKGAIQLYLARPPQTYFCKFGIDPKDLAEPMRTVPINLEKADYGIQNPNVVAYPLPTPNIRLTYAKYVTREEVDLALPDPKWEGSPQPGYKVESVTLLQPKARVRVPANFAVDKLVLRSVPVANRVLGSVEPAQLDPEDLRRGIRLLNTPNVEIKIVPATGKLLPLEVVPAARPEHQKRIQLVDTSIEVEVRGPEELVRDITATALQAYVVVTDKDMETPGNFAVKEHAIGCHILDPKYQGKVQIALMPGTEPANRAVRIRVLPK